MLLKSLDRIKIFPDFLDEEIMKKCNKFYIKRKRMAFWTSFKW